MSSSKKLIDWPEEILLSPLQMTFARFGSEENHRLVVFFSAHLKAFIYIWATSAAYSLEIHTFFMAHEPPAVNKVVDRKDAYS